MKFVTDKANATSLTAELGIPSPVKDTLTDDNSRSWGVELTLN